MLDTNKIKDELNAVKRKLNITWADDDTDKKVIDMMLDAEVELNHMLGAEIDYFRPGMERGLYLDYMLYAWNDCRNEFEDTYRKEILRVRHKYMVKAKNEK